MEDATRTVDEITDHCMGALERMAVRERQIRDRIVKLAETQPQTKICEEHQYIRRIDFDQSVRRSHETGSDQIVYVGCPACRSKQKVVEQSQWLIARGVPVGIAHCNFANYEANSAEQEAHKAKALKFSTQTRGFLLLVGSPKGVGKTHLAIATMREIGTGRFTTNAQLMTMIGDYYRDKRSPNIKAICSTTKLLVLDDLGISRGGSDELPTLHEILTTRHANKLPTIITSNLNKDQIDQAVGDRMADRLKECCFARLVFTGESVRPKMRDQYLGGEW